MPNLLAPGLGLSVVDAVLTGTKQLGWFPVLGIETGVVDKRYPYDDPRRFGAVGDATTDDTTAIQNWYASQPDGGTARLPMGFGFKFTSGLSFNRPVNIIMPPGSCFIPSVGATTDGITINNTASASLYRVRLELTVLSATANCCRNALVINRTHDSEINCHVKAAAAAYGAVINGCLSNQNIRIVISANFSYAFPAAMPTNSVNCIFDATNTIACNANKFVLLIEGGGIGFFMDDQHLFGNNEVSGVVEGTTGAIAFQMKNCVSAHVHDLHLESNTGTQSLVGCQQTKLGSGIIAAGSGAAGNFTLTTCTACIVDGMQCDSFTVASDCDRIAVGALTYGISGGAITDPGAHILLRGPLVGAAGFSTNAKSFGGIVDPVNLMQNGDFSRWPGGDSAIPDGFTFISANPTWTKCGDNLTDTTRNVTPFCAKVVSASGAGPAWSVDWKAVGGGWVTAWAWVWVPAGQPAPSFQCWLDFGAAVVVGDTTALTGQWVRLAATFFFSTVTHTSAQIVLKQTGGGTLYLADVGYAFGLIAPNRYIAPIRRQDASVVSGNVTTSAAAMPTTGTFRAGDFVMNNAPGVLGTAGSQYVILGWKRLTTGSANVLNTDWVQCRTLTGT